MKISKSKWKIRSEDFGPLYKYIENPNVTDINFNGEKVWIDDLLIGRYETNDKLTNEFIELFTTRVADIVSQPFNKYNPLLEAETDTLRISIIHEEYAASGRSISIRKTPVIRRLYDEKLLNENYCSKEVLCFLKKCILSRMNILIGGETGTGKTELLKYLTSFIPEYDRVITIEDTLEIHYREINKNKDVVELKTDNNRFTYSDAIKASLRQNPQWIILSEARGREVKYLLESMSTGMHSLTTIHTDDLRKVPDRVKNMIGDSLIEKRAENDIYNYVDVGILLRKRFDKGKIYRYISQICLYSREDNSNVLSLIMDDSTINENIEKVPKEIMKKFQKNGFNNPFEFDEDFHVIKGNEKKKNDILNKIDSALREEEENG